jgi:prepilin-type N-terminal cleavage/methylation domain-containing protein/prepilin-type processing-associated H-X9-DG protein
MQKNLCRGFTLIELFVVITIILILASIAYPIYTNVQERARATQDMNNLRQIGLATQMYVNDNDGLVPASTTWPGTSTTPGLYSKYMPGRKSFQSPFDKRGSLETDTAPVSYGFNANVYAASPGIARDITRVVSPSLTILMAPRYVGDPRIAASWTGTTTTAPNLTAGGDPANTRGTHGNARRINALFCDLHVEDLSFGPSSVVGTFQDTTSNPVGQKHWDPTK